MIIYLGDLSELSFVVEAFRYLRHSPKIFNFLPGQQKVFCLAPSKIEAKVQGREIQSLLLFVAEKITVLKIRNLMSRKFQI